MGCLEYGELKNLVNNLNKKFDEDNIDKFFVNTSQLLTEELYDRLFVKTPVITGFLRHGWNVGLGMKYQNARFYPKNPILFPKKGQHYSAVYINTKKIIPNKDGNKFTVHFKNPVSYAPFVEYGHKITVKGRKAITDSKGRIKLFSSNKWVKPYKEGHHMTKKSVEEVNKIKNEIVRREFNKFLKG